MNVEPRQFRPRIGPPPPWSPEEPRKSRQQSSDLSRSSSELHRELNESHSIPIKLPKWLAGSPRLKSLLLTRDKDECLSDRSYEVWLNTFALKTWCNEQDWNSSEAPAFLLLNLIEALEKERQISLDALRAHVKKLEAELASATSAMAGPLPRDGTRGDSGGVSMSQSLEGYDNNIPAITISKSPLSSNLFSIDGSTRVNSSGPIQAVRPQNKPTRSRATERHKDLSKFHFKCDICEKGFTRSTTLREHKRSHLNDKLFICLHCPRQFVRLKDRNRHQTTKHTQKTIECGRPFMLLGEQLEWGCNRRFAREDGLVSHLRTEKGWDCLKPLLEEDERQMFLDNVVMGDIEDEFNVHCSMTNKSCQKEFGSLFLLELHLTSTDGRKCAAESLIHHILKIYRGKASVITVEPLEIDVEEVQSSATDRVEVQVPGEGNDAVESRRDREGFTQLHPRVVSTDARLEAERLEELLYEHAEENSEFNFETRPGNVASLQHSLPDDMLPTSVSRESSEREIRQTHGLFTNWELVERSDNEVWRMGDPFHIVITCPTRIEGTFFFSFETESESLISPLKYLFGENGHCRFTGFIPQCRSFPNEDVQIRVYPKSFAGRNLQEEEEAYFVVGMLMTKNLTVAPRYLS